VSVQSRGPLAALAVVTLLTVAAPLAASAQTAVFVVRHAEKVDESKDPLLSAKGQARAQALARQLAAAAVKAIYVTEYKRTGLTAAPLAAALGLTPIVVRAGDTPGLVEKIRKDNPADVVLVVGHSNTLPDILKRFGHPDPVEIADDEYDSLFVVVPRAALPPAVLRLKF
jgi:broad specificity phosphatase PhoE